MTSTCHARSAARRSGPGSRWRATTRPATPEADVADDLDALPLRYVDDEPDQTGNNAEPQARVVYCAPRQLTRAFEPGAEPWPSAVMSWNTSMTEGERDLTPEGAEFTAN